MRRPRSTCPCSRPACGRWARRWHCRCSSAWAGAASRPAPAPSGNPLVRTYRTSDGRFISLSCLQPGRYWAEVCTLLDHPDLIDDPRFADAASIVENAAAQPKRAPEFNEHGDAILESLSVDWEKIVELKVQGVVA